MRARTTRASWIVALAALAPVGLAQGSPGPPSSSAGSATRLVCLRDGRTFWGAIEHHDETGVEFRRLTTGGLVPLPWSFLDPAQEEELRLALGYVDAGADEVLVDADRLLLLDGTELVGRIVDRSGGHVWLKRASGTIPIPQGSVASSTLVRAPALDVYTREELYQERAGELSAELVREGEPGARAHVELGQYAERLFDFARAFEHYQIAARLAPGYRPDFLREALERTREKAALQEQVDLLAEADLWRGRGQFERAWEVLRTFPDRFPGSPLLEDWNRMKRRVERYQERALREEVVARWHHWSASLARRAAREFETFEASRRYAEEALGDELLRLVHADLTRIAPRITLEEVQRLWDEREGGRYRQASYGLGTWLLGEERALEVPGEEGDPVLVAAEENTQEAARRRLEERIRRYLENQQALVQARGPGADAEDPEDFWSSWDVSGRSQWLLADFVETSGAFEIQRIRFANCRECGGTGVRTISFTGGAIAGQTAGERKVRCPTCHGIGRVRRVRYR